MMLHWSVLARGNGYQFCLPWVFRFVLTRLPTKDALSNPPHLTAPLVQGAQAFVLHLEPTQRALGSVHSIMDYALYLVSHCESFLNAAMESLQCVLKKDKQNTTSIHGIKITV